MKRKLVAGQDMQGEVRWPERPYLIAAHRLELPVVASPAATKRVDLRLIRVFDNVTMIIVR